MVAESYAQTRNLEQARARLAGWSEEDLARTSERGAGGARRAQPAAAQNVQDLAVALGVTTAAGAPVTGDQQPPQAQRQPRHRQPRRSERRVDAAPDLHGGHLHPAGGRRACAPGVSSSAGGGRLRETNGVPGAARVTDELDAVAGCRPGEGRAGPREETVVEEVTAVPRRLRRTRRFGRISPMTTTRHGAGRCPADSATPCRARAGRSVADRCVCRQAARPAASAAAAAAAAAANGNLKRLVENTAVYQMGEPDYDEAFDINDPADGFMGQCRPAADRAVRPRARPGRGAAGVAVGLERSGHAGEGADERGRVSRHCAALAACGRARGRLGAARRRVRR